MVVWLVWQKKEAGNFGGAGCKTTFQPESLFICLDGNFGRVTDGGK